MDVKLNFTFGREVSEKKSDFAINLVSHYENVANVNFNEYEFKRFLKYPLQTWLLQTVGAHPEKQSVRSPFVFLLALRCMCQK